MKTINKIYICFLFLIISINCQCYGQTYISGNTYYGTNNYVEYIPGGLPIIISIPHNGSIDPGITVIPDRSIELANNACTSTITEIYTGSDGNSLLTSSLISEALYNLTGCYPYIIINHLKRIKLDPNREICEAACGNPIAETAYNEFHAFIESAKEDVESTFGKGLYIDLHGHDHGDWIELGYLLGYSALNKTDAVINTNYASTTSIHNLISSNLLSLSLSDLLRGPKSLGSLLEAYSYTSYPSSAHPVPIDDGFYAGAYDVRMHGSRYGGNIDGIQVELSQSIRDTPAKRVKFANDFAQILNQYMNTLYFGNNMQTKCNIYVDASFNVSGNGTEAKPYKTLQEAQNSPANGIINIFANNYNITPIILNKKAKYYSLPKGQLLKTTIQ